MSTKFVFRFAMILLLVLLLSALAIHFFFNPGATVILWIFAMPLILGIPILSSVVLATNEELDIHAVN
ncbi:hypothetical protein [Acinetobacter tianfuensis]|uniref:Uncharacterized protein n=1 Tax=Acinetobacter tianfuensis TaxID=2419603 RepID=A0A3A8ELC3_9GAMM|nr:hypothetical protein [Acinetobacter tianfuensis]RKG29661.1 hypothetical protein D7V32_13875 [Acinetobacter tianfuensis]